MKAWKIAAMVPFAAFLGLLAYLFWLRASGDSRAQDLKLDSVEVNIFESLWLTIAVFGIIAVWISSIWRSFRARRYGWLVMVFLIWPLAAAYVWKDE